MCHAVFVQIRAKQSCTTLEGSMGNNMRKTVLLVNGSPNQTGNTASALNMAESVFRKHGIQTVWFQIGTKPVRGCIGCDSCQNTHRCAFADDGCNALIEAMCSADAIMIGTPVYFAGPNGALCALLDRAFYAVANYGQMLKGKPAAAIATCWRAGATPSLDRLNKYFTFSQMPVVSSDYWTGYLGKHDQFGADAIRTLAENMAELLQGSAT